MIKTKSELKRSLYITLEANDIFEIPNNLGGVFTIQVIKIGQIYSQFKILNKGRESIKQRSTYELRNYKSDYVIKKERGEVLS